MVIHEGAVFPKALDLADLEAVAVLVDHEVAFVEVLRLVNAEPPADPQDIEVFLFALAVNGDISGVIVYVRDSVFADIHF